MQKTIILILLGVILTGCRSSQISNIPENYNFEGLQNNGIIIGKISYQGIPGEFKEGLLVFKDQATDKLFPIFIKNGVSSKSQNKTDRMDYYYFVELPPGYYYIDGVYAIHAKYGQLENYLLNANFTIEKNEVKYVGTIRVKSLAGNRLSMLGPVTEEDIINEGKETIAAFRKQYPQFQDKEIKTRLIDRYELFRPEGEGREF